MDGGIYKMQRKKLLVLLMFLLKANFKNQCEVELFIVFMWISSEFKPHRNSDMETLKCSHLHQNVANNAERLKKGFN